MVKTIQVRIPFSLYRDIFKLKKSMEKETKERFGKHKPVTFVKAAAEYHRKKNNNFFAGGLL